jgi:TetR/AcrR family transcriptional repressor of nem operon
LKADLQSIKMMFVIFLDDDYHIGQGSVALRVSRDKAAESRKRVIETAGKLFRERGFGGVGVADLMRDAGLTHGGFYKHFESKTELEAEACAHLFEGAAGRMEALAATPAEDLPGAIDAYMANYLSPDANAGGAARCPMAALAMEIPRAPEPVQQAYCDGMRRYLAGFETAFANADEAQPREAALFTLASMIGALALARSVARVDEKLAGEILAAAHARLARPHTL